MDTGYQLRRKNPELNEALEALDARYEAAGSNAVKAFASLTPTELEFIYNQVQRCLEDPRFYLENYHFIRLKSLQIVPLWPFWDSQEMFLESFQRQFDAGAIIRLIVLKARQLGITTISVAIMCWLVFFHPMAHVLSMSDEEQRTVVNFAMARTAHDCLPWWMKPEKRYDSFGQLLGFDRSKEGDRARSTGLQSQIYFESANQPSGAAYSKALFGAHLAEVARYRSSRAITEGVLGSLAELPGSIGIMESTAQGRGGVWHRLCRRAQSKSIRWDFVFMEWFREPGYVVTVPEGFTRTAEEEALTKKAKAQCNYDLSDGQLAWRRVKKAEFEAADGTDEIFAQEYPLTPAEAFISKGRTAFSKRRLQEMLTHFCKPPIWTGEISLDQDNKTPHLSRVIDGSLRIWEWPNPKYEYKISADPSMGIEGGDPGCIQVMCVPEDITQPLRQVARWHGYTGTSKFTRILAAIGYLFNTAEIAPECNQIATVASDLVKVLLYPRWYRWMREDKVRNSYSFFIGWLTTARNKAELIGRMREALNEWTVIIRCEDDIDEMFDFVETEEGSERYEAREGQHDDCTMALMICYYIATQLRPRTDSSQTEEKPPENQDWQNSDYSPMYDKDEMPVDHGGTPDFYML